MGQKPLGVGTKRGEGLGDGILDNLVYVGRPHRADRSHGRAGARRKRVADVRQVLRQIPSRSPILADLIEQGHVGIAGGLYDIESGEVKFFDEVF